MERQFSFTRAELIEAFRRWNADVPKEEDGSLAGPSPDDPEQSADLLIGYLEPVA